MNPHLQRAYLLVRQSRYEMAAQELQQVLVAEPSNAEAHALLAICYCHAEKYAEATTEAELAVHLDPEEPWVHFALAHVMTFRRRYVEAERSVQEAIRLDPYNPEYFATLSQILLAREQWQPALTAAEQALALDPEHAASLNWRAIALVRLGRTHDAGKSIESALAREPENSFSHANMGWTSLEHSDPKQAMLHFREALRLDPENEYARQGLVRALNARNIIYRILLRYLLWMAKLSPRARWGVIVGGWLANRVLRGIGRQAPELQPWITPILILYAAFVLLTWLGEPLFNLMLRVHPLGRHALSSDQRKGANLVGMGVLGGLVALGLGFALDSMELIIVALSFALLLLPASAIYRCDEGWPRRAMTAITVGLGLLAAVAIGAMTLARMNADAALAENGSNLFGGFLLGSVISLFAATYLTGAVARR